VKTCTVLLALLGTFAMLSPAPADDAKPLIKIGIIGCDTSHVIAFTKIFHDPKKAQGDLAGIRVVAAYPGGSPDIAASRDRVEKYTNQLRDEFGVEICKSIEEMLKKVDVVLLESVDGRPHLKQAIPVIKAGKILFIDKPVAGSLADAIRIFEMARMHKVPVFSSSSLRFYPGVRSMRDNDKVGKIVGCDAHGPCSLEPTHPDLFWYGIHGVEMLYTIMGPGCEKVTRAQTKGTELVTGTWKDGRVGTFRGIREGKSGYGATVFGAKAIAQAGGSGGYEPLLVEIAKFFRTGQPPVSAEETIELFAFMEAADESKRQGGAPVSIASVMEKARKQIAEAK
jgi:GFO/IDH/MocA oxidoreductase family protein